MNRKEIITADLCGRLIHGVKAVLTCDWTEDFDDEIDEESLQEGSVWTISGYSGYSIPLGDGDLDGFLFTKVNAYASFGMNGGWKPLLFSSLTEPITVAGYNDGLPFVPREELKKLGFSHVDWITTEREHWIEKYGFERWIRQVPYGVIYLLNQWHVNYRLLPGEYIEATNEYA